MLMSSMRDELVKIAAGISTAEAVEALRRLRELEEKRPTGGQVARGALAGTAAGTLASLASDVAKGAPGIRESVGEAMKAPTLAGKAGRLGLSALKGVAGKAAYAGTFGATMPVVRQYLDTGVEKAKLREYLGTNKRGRIRSEVVKTLGLG